MFRFLLWDQIRMRPQPLLGFGLTMQFFSHWRRWKTAGSQLPTGKTGTRDEMSRVMRVKKKTAGKADVTRE
jgi:hypothetical protein